MKKTKKTKSPEYLLGDIVAFHGLDHDTCICEVTELREKSGPVVTIIDNPCYTSVSLGQTLLPRVSRDREDTLLYRRGEQS